MEEMKNYPVVIELPVVWGEMDSYQHVNNVVYFRYFESARLEYFRRMDWFEYEKEADVGPILASTDAKYIRPLTYPDTILVGVKVSIIKEDRFIFEYKLYSTKLDTIATVGTGTIVTFNYKTGKKAPVPIELLRRIEKLEATVSG